MFKENQQVFKFTDGSEIKVKHLVYKTGANNWQNSKNSKFIGKDTINLIADRLRNQSNLAKAFKTTQLKIPDTYEEALQVLDQINGVQQ